MARQVGESIPLFVLRRKAWYNMMLDMDSSLQLPEAILAEQTLQNAGISHDHQLLIRAAVHGDITMNKICEELVAQHSRIHEVEARRSKGHFSRFNHKGYSSKGYGKDRGRSSWHRAYHATPNEEYYDCEDWDNNSQSLSGFDEVETYGEEHQAYVMDEEDYLHQVYMSMIEDGLDEYNTEAMEYAAEIMQAEAEAFYVREKAGHGGHKGFSGGGRQFQVHGHLTMEERRARVQAMKSRTTCRKCGQSGHWANDPQCPKSYKSAKGKSKGGSPSSTTSTTTSSPKSSKGGKGGKSDKPRTVFFTVNEYQQTITEEEHKDFEANMVTKAEQQALQDREETADEKLDRLIMEAQIRQATPTVRHAIGPPASQGPVPSPATPGSSSASHALAEDFSVLQSDARKAHLDTFMAMINDPKDAEWRDAYNERWYEFYPGHPLYTQEDRELLQKWRWKAERGLPRLPVQLTTTPSSPTASSQGNDDLLRPCAHMHTTRQGSNAYLRVLKCKDCNKYIEYTKLDKPQKMEVDSDKKTGIKCEHEEKDWRGSTGTTWQWKCKSCGHIEKGSRSDGKLWEAKSAAAVSGAPTTGQVDKVLELFSMAVGLQKEIGGDLTVETMDKIYEKCKNTALGKASGSSSTFSPPTRSSEPVSIEKLQGTYFTSGVHKGHSFKEIYSYEKSYVKTIIAKFKNDNIKDRCLVQFAKYCIARQEREESEAYMVQDDDRSSEEIYVILDTGCNNTCHGSRWMEKFVNYMGMQPELQSAEGRFRGVGGKVEVAGKRTIPVCMKTLDEEFVPGNITSIELENSDTPLLLSSAAQKALGFVLDMSEYTAYSKTLDKELEIINLNGLPAIKLHPGDETVRGIAMSLADYEIEPEEIVDENYGVNEEISDDNVTEAEDDNVTAETTDNETDSNGTSSEERHLPLHEHRAKTLSKGQRRMLEDSLDEMEKEDCALWSTLQGGTRRPRKMLPRGCKTFMKELFAGAATLSLMAATMGLCISAPVDVEIDERYDLLQSCNRDRLWQEIEDEDPYLLSMSPLCAPWSPWQRLNVTKSDELYAKIMENRKKWYPVVAWLGRLVERRLELGREVLLENPWPSLLWELKCFIDLMDKQLRNQVTGEPLEVVRLDQCMYGLVGDSGTPQQKATGMLLSSAKMKERLRARCDGQHPHEHLEGNKTKKAEQWPTELCKAIIHGALDEMKAQIIQHAFPAEHEMETNEGMDTLDGIQDLDDVAEHVHKRRRVDLNALDTEEDYEQGHDPSVEEVIHEKEKARKSQWLKISREKRIAIRRLHQMMGHCSNQALVRMLRSSLCEKDVIEAAQHFRCQSCDEIKSDERPRTVRPSNPCHQVKFNDELAANVFEITDAKGARHSILSMVDMATHYHVAVRVAAGGTPPSKVCADAINMSWLSWAGAPRTFTCDQGVHNRGRVAALLQSQGTEIRRTGARAPYQLGTAERHGGLLKEMLKRAVHDRQLFGASVISALCSECARAKNVLINNQGFSPAQWVLGHTPEDLSSLASQDPENHLGVHQGLVDAEEKTPQEQFMLQLLMRQTAKEMYMQVDASQRNRKALLRKAVPIRGPYRTGDLVCFSKQGKWYGPARVLTNEGKSSLWLVHGGVTVLVSETSCRPASTQEIMKKHVLELRPARKRKRELYSSHPEDEEHVPFSDDGQEARTLRQRTEQQAPFIDIQDTEPMSAPEPPIQNIADSNDPGVAASPGTLATEDSPEVIMETTPEVEPPFELEPSSEPSPPPGLEPDPSGTSSMSSLTYQPETEVSPQVTNGADEENQTETPLTQALRRNPDILDGSFMRRSNNAASYAWEESIRPAPSIAFLMSRQHHKVKKKVQRTKKTGAGRELQFDKESPQMQAKLIETRTKEWSNWTKYTDGRWLSDEQLQQLRKDIPGLRVIPTRWVDVNKAEPNEPDQLKSRLVVRGDLEDASKMRTDSPTCSMTMMSLSLILSACRDTDIWTGDISAAFLQGSKLDRTLVLSMPRGGIPGEPEGRYYMVSSTVYGTKDAPRGWYKNLHASLLDQGFTPVPHEAAAYSLRTTEGELAGLVVVHVDDLLWTGGDLIESKMQAICQKYKFGKLSKNEFRYCGREVKKDSTGVHVSCPSLVDRVKPIYLSPEQKKMKDARAPDQIKEQLRSVIGSLAWLARVCRPDLSYAVSYLQSNVSQATYSDAIFANNIVKVARASKNKGISYPLKAFPFEECMVVGIQDASFANDTDTSGSGKRLGLRSQSGRLTCLAHRSFQHTHQGHLFLLDWHSTCIKRVCRSTLQAETMSMTYGMEECEHLRFVLHGLWHDHDRNLKEWQVQAQDTFFLNLYTDCHSLYEHVGQPGLHTVQDKRLAIDLSAARQLVWRKQGELVGDPLLTDHLPEDRTTSLFWTSTNVMPADSLTKAMRPGGLDKVMAGSEYDLSPKERYPCETEDETRPDIRSYAGPNL